jgi:two-component system response regulator PilR (NtrC family)
MSRGRILVVDDDTSLRQFLGILLKKEGYRVELASGGREGVAAMEREPADLVVTDLYMGDMDGMSVLRTVKEHWPDTEVVMITAYATTQNAVEAMKQGAFDYVVKPFNVDEVKVILEKAFEKRAISAENRNLKAALKDRFGYGSLIGRSPVMLRVYDLMDRIKDTPVTVLVTGESGTGKELVARAIHYEGERRAKPFLSINCGAIPENLIEAELFGYRKGAFTGAMRDHEGLFCSAEGGTLFLDEVAEMPPSTQVKLLRALQERKVRPIGGTEERPVDVRIIAATNRDLLEEVRGGNFREDLYYRLKVVAVHLPPLRERAADLPLLMQHFLEQYGREFGRPGMLLDDETRRLLLRWSWPGNVRELENVVQRCVALARGSAAGPDVLPDEIAGRAAPPSPRAEFPMEVDAGGLALEQVLERYERQLLESALRAAGGVKKEAARLLRISFRSLRYRLQKIGLEDPAAGDTEPLARSVRAD